MNLIGKTIEFNKYLDDTEIEEGMRFKVLSVRTDKYDSTHELYLDMSDYEEYNKQLMTADFYDENRNPILKWCETKHYPSDLKIKVYVSSIKDGDEFNILAPETVKMSIQEELKFYKDLSEKYSSSIDKLIDILKPSIGDSYAEQLRKDFK